MWARPTIRRAPWPKSSLRIGARKQRAAQHECLFLADPHAPPAERPPGDAPGHEHFRHRHLHGHTASAFAHCPACKGRSKKVHSRYSSALPRISALARYWRDAEGSCSPLLMRRRILERSIFFCERLPERDRGLRLQDPPPRGSAEVDRLRAWRRDRCQAGKGTPYTVSGRGTGDSSANHPRGVRCRLIYGPAPLPRNSSFPGAGPYSYRQGSYPSGRLPS
jgi:hypothetical protein